MISHGTTRKVFDLRRKGRSLFRRSPKEDRTYKGIVFDSKAEVKRYKELELLRRAGEIVWFKYHPWPFNLAGVKYTPDFLWVDNKALTHYEEVKPKLRGRFRQQALREFRRNQKQVWNLYGVKVELKEI